MFQNHEKPWWARRPSGVVAVTTHWYAPWSPLSLSPGNSTWPLTSARAVRILLLLRLPLPTIVAGIQPNTRRSAFDTGRPVRASATK